MSDEKILICVLTTHERTGWVCTQLAEWLTDLPLTGNGVQFSVTYAKNFVPAASARNFFCRRLSQMEPKPTWALMIDNDMAPPPNLLDTIKNAPKDAAVVVPQFQMWDESKPSVTLCWGMDEKVAPQRDGNQRFTIEPGRFYPLTKCGTGAIFIRPWLFDKISMPYFWYTYNADQGMDGTEDINFCKKVVDAGCKIYGNSSVIVGHYHNVNLAVLANYVYGSKQVDKPKEVPQDSVVPTPGMSSHESPVAATCPVG